MLWPVIFDCVHVCSPRAAVAKIPIQTISFISCFIAYLTFSEEFRGCSAQASADSCVVRRGSSARTDTDLPCEFGLKMSETRRRSSRATMLKDRERHRKDRSNYHCRNRTYLDMEYEQLNTQRWKKQVRKENKLITSTLAMQAMRFHVPLHHWRRFLWSFLGPLLHGKFKTYFKKDETLETSWDYDGTLALLCTDNLSPPSPRVEFDWLSSNYLTFLADQGLMVIRFWLGDSGGYMKCPP